MIILFLKQLIAKSKKQFFALALVIVSVSNGHAAAELSGKALAQQRFTLKQAWQLSQNYAYGLTVDADPYNALVWQYVYVTLLPRSYPGGYQLLAPYKAKVDKEKYDEAYQQSKALKQHYHLPSRMDEKRLLDAFRAKVSKAEYAASKPDVYGSFQSFLKAVQTHDEALAKQYKNHWQTLQDENLDKQLIYGRVQLNGPAIESLIIRNQPLMIDRFGFFIGAVSSPLILTSAGFDIYVKHFSLPSDPISLGLIALNSLPKKQKGTIVGQVLVDGFKPENLGLALSFDFQYHDKDEPWFSPTIPVTKLANGQFYAKNLTPGRYQLTVSYGGKKQLIETTVTSQGIKTLKPISL